MATQTIRTDKILELVRKEGVLRPRGLDSCNIPRTYLSRLCTAGKLQRIGRGLHVLPESGATEHHSLAEVCKRIPKGVVCLLSALRFHDLTTQAPFEVWLAIGEKSWRPRLNYPPLRIVRFSQAALSAGVEEYQIEGVTVHIYSPAKTVADCFKYRNKIGLDVAIETLRECRRARRSTTRGGVRFARLLLNLEFAALQIEIAHHFVFERRVQVAVGEGEVVAYLDHFQDCQGDRGRVVQ